MIDITTFDSKGVDRKILCGIVDDLNHEYSKFFKSIEKSYKAVVLLEEERAINNIVRVTDKFGLDNMNPDFLENMKADLQVIRAYTSKQVMKDLEKNFTPMSFLRASKKALLSMEPPMITVEHYFQGIKSIAPKKQLLSRRRKGMIIMNFEGSRFMNFWYPHQAAEMITKILERIRSMS